jgi:hypothetical protein
VALPVVHVRDLATGCRWSLVLNRSILGLIESGVFVRRGSCLFFGGGMWKIPGTIGGTGDLVSGWLVVVSVLLR